MSAEEIRLEYAEKLEALFVKQKEELIALEERHREETIAVARECGNKLEAYGYDRKVD